MIHICICTVEKKNILHLRCTVTHESIIELRALVIMQMPTARIAHAGILIDVIRERKKIYIK